TVQVDGNGTAAMPLIGSFNALGKTPAELSQIIKQRLTRYIRNPDVTVSIDTVSQTVTVDGQVAKPGAYPVTGRMTLMRAIASAQGSNEFADTSYVVVFRR
ncbi:polysaccharide biosynthesis/export family protein, partial [Mycobacterium tuberculosis]